MALRRAPWRSVVLAAAVAAAGTLLVETTSHAFQLFVGSPLPSTVSRSETRNPNVAMRGRPKKIPGDVWYMQRYKQMYVQSDEEKEKEENAKVTEYFLNFYKGKNWRVRRRGVVLDGDLLQDNLPLFYQEQLLGKGGPPLGFIRELILRSYSTGFHESGWPIRKLPFEFSGPYGHPTETDFDNAFQTLKKAVNEGWPVVGQDDGKGWMWLVAHQHPGGIVLTLSPSPPYGKRPLAVIKRSDPDEFWNNVDWVRITQRLDSPELWGVTASKFPYPLERVRQDV